jgi:hypothetical protein
MTRIPTSALLLGFAGLIPFLFGAFSALAPEPPAFGLVWGAEYAGPSLLQIYGIVILCFMSGVIWGFATKTEGRQAALFYALSVIPAIFVFLTAFAEPRPSLVMLIAGFIALLGVDITAQRQGIAPPWWMALRLPLTAVAVSCLLIGVLA